MINLSHINLSPTHLGGIDLSEIKLGYQSGGFDSTKWYGVEWDTTVQNPSATRIGDMSLHKSLPIHSGMRRCLLLDDGTVNYYLDANNSLLKEDGTLANLDGRDGQIMVEIPLHYRKFESEGNTRRVKISQYPIPGFHKVAKTYRSAYEATVQRSSLKLSSVVNNTPDYRGGGNQSSFDGTYKSMLGMPATAISLTNFRKYARNRGLAGKNNAGWNCDVYEIQKTCYWLYIVEYANRNSQLSFNKSLTDEGYRQGGLSNGVTTINSSKWSVFNGYYPFIPCGTTNPLGNNTGVVEFTMPDEYDPGVVVKVNVPSYRGIENPFGHLWSWTDGCKCRIQSNDIGGESIFYFCDDPAVFQDSSYEGYETRGFLPRSNGYIKEVMMDKGDNMPSLVGGGSTVYFCDYFYTNIPASGESQRGVLFGGAAYNGAAAGLSCSNASYAPSGAAATFGSRLCFIPATLR